ncbi:MAG: lipopolysaccharide biosynthesis protein [Lachnospiraceae bacterium]|nr:lipopolysaccharide biosynthesis protein [Lachnospiraceae bacterium]
MDDNELKNKTITGSFWSLIERFGYLSCQFLSNLVLARLLMPDDFGTIGLLMVFVTLSNVLIDSGLTASVIQKEKVTETDKATVFITNIVLAISVYLIIFFAAPFIASYFKSPDLTLFLRCLELIVIIDALCAIQNSLLMRDMDFKILTKIKLISIVISAGIAIALAYYGLGIWALIIQYILFSTIRTLLTWFVTKWHPSFDFSIKSFKSLFSYGSKLLVSTFVAELYVNLQQLLIGRFYTSADLGYYSQARLFQNIPTGTVSQVINSVAFPAYAKLQSERQKLLEMFRQNIRFVAFVNTPLMVLLAVVAYPLFVFLYSEKWIGAVGYFQFLCIFFGIFLAIHQCSLSLLKAIGRSDYVLHLEIIKKILGIAFIFIGMKIWGIWGILYALGLNSFIEIFLNGFYVKKELGYGGVNVLIDIAPSLLVSLISGCLAYLALRYFFTFDSYFLQTVLASLLFVLTYVIIAWVFGMYGFKIVCKLVARFIHGRK